MLDSIRDLVVNADGTYSNLPDTLVAIRDRVDLDEQDPRIPQHTLRRRASESPLVPRPSDASAAPSLRLSRSRRSG